MKNNILKKIKNQRLNKKASIDDPADLLFLILGFTFVAFFLFSFLHVNMANAQSESLESLDYLKGANTILRILQTPVVYNNVTMDFQDAIVLSDIKPTIQNDLERIAHSFLDPIYGKDKWRLTLCYGTRGPSGCAYLNYPANQQTAQSYGASENILFKGDIMFLAPSSREITIFLKVIK